MTEHGGRANRPADTTVEALGRWQELDRRLRHGELDSFDGALDAVFTAGLARRSLGAKSSIETLCAIEPARNEHLVPGPVLLIAFEDGMYGRPRFYRPVSDELRADTGAFAS